MVLHQVELLHPDGRPVPEGVDAVVVAHRRVAEHGPPEAEVDLIGFRRDRELDLADGGPIGGGAVLDPENVQDLREAGVLIYLTARAEIVLRRVGDAKSRPLLRNDPQAREAYLDQMKAQFGYSYPTVTPASAR